MPVVVTYTFVGGPGNKAKASQINQNFADLVAKFNAGIVDADIAAGAAIDGSKLADDSIPNAKLIDDSITDAKLASDGAAPGLDTGRAVSGDHIKTLTEAHLDRILPAAGIAKDKLKITIATAAVSIGTTAGIPGFQTGVAIGTFPKATYDLIGVYLKNRGGSSGTSGALVILTPNDGGANWTLDVTVLAPTGTFTGTACAAFIEKV